MPTAANALDISAAGLVKFDGTATFTGVTVTQYNVLIGAASNGISSIAPSATSGVPVISQGSSANPTFGTAVVAGGGTGNTTFTAYSVICAGTTATGAFQNVSGLGSSGQILSSQGAGALPQWVNSPAVGGSLVLISSQTASSSASITFTSSITSYNSFLLVFSNLQAASGSSVLDFKVSTNAGSTWLSSGYVAAYITLQLSGTFGWPANSSGSTSLFPMAGQLSSSASQTVAGNIWINDVTSGAYLKLRSEIIMQSTNPFLVLSGGVNTNTSINGFQVIMSTGNITTGTFTLYGILE